MFYIFIGKGKTHKLDPFSSPQSPSWINCRFSLPQQSSEDRRKVCSECSCLRFPPRDLNASSDSGGRKRLGCCFFLSSLLMGCGSSYTSGLFFSYSFPAPTSFLPKGPPCFCVFFCLIALISFFFPLVRGGRVVVMNSQSTLIQTVGRVERHSEALGMTV